MKRVFDTSVKAIDFPILLLRLTSGSFMLFGHGIPKLGAFSQDPIQFLDFMGLGAPTSLVLAVAAEIGCSILLILGLGTRLAVIPLIITMIVAVTVFHAADPFGVIEKPLLFLLIFVVLLITGSGKYSVDQLISKK